MIVTLSGASGSGKSTLIKEIFNNCCNCEQAVSFTARSARLDDDPAVIRCVLPAEFELLRADNHLLWPVSVHGFLYASLRSQYLKLIHDTQRILLSDMAPNTVDMIRSLAQCEGAENNVKCIYLLSPGVDELRRRLSTRGTVGCDLEHRIQECLHWDKLAVSASKYDLVIPAYPSTKEKMRAILIGLERNSGFDFLLST